MTVIHYLYSTCCIQLARTGLKWLKKLKKTHTTSLIKVQGRRKRKKNKTEQPSAQCQKNYIPEYCLVGIIFSFFSEAWPKNTTYKSKIISELSANVTGDVGGLMFSCFSGTREWSSLKGHPSIPFLRDKRTDKSGSLSQKTKDNEIILALMNKAVSKRVIFYDFLLPHTT